MANAILPTGYEATVRTDMGVTTSVLSDAEIQSKATLAEALIKKAVPTYAALTGDNLTFLQFACIAQVCVLLCPGMPNRVKTAETSETGYSFKLQEVDWKKQDVMFNASIRDYIGLALGGEVVMPVPLGVVSNARPEI